MRASGRFKFGRFSGSRYFLGASLEPLSPIVSLNLDFKEDRFALAGGGRPFDDLMDYSSTGLGTFHNAAGDLVWNAHNLFTHSTDFNSADYIAYALKPVLTDGHPAPDGSNTAQSWNCSDTPGGAGGKRGGFVRLGGGLEGQHTLGVWLRASAPLSMRFGHSDGTSVSVDVTTDWQLFTYTNELPNAQSRSMILYEDTNDDIDVYVWGCHLYRSDLGGMADNPDNSRGAGFEKYVPTGATPVYKARRGAYVNGVAAGMRFESAAATNLLPYSSDMVSATHTPLSVSITPNDADGPRGINTMSRLEITSAGTGDKGILLVPTGAVGTPLAISAVVRRDGHRYVGFWGFGNGAEGVVFDTQGMVAQINGAWDFCGIEPVGADHARIWATVTPASATQLYLGLFSSMAGDKLADRVLGSFMHVDMVQIEEGIMPTSYVPTAGSIVTRPAETLRVRASALPSVMPAGVSFAIKGMMSYADVEIFGTAVPMNWELDSTNYIMPLVIRGAGNTGSIWFRHRSASGMVTAKSPNNVFAPGLNTPFSVASRHAGDTASGAVDGVSFTGTASYPVPDLAGVPLEIGPVLNGYLDSFRMWDRDIGLEGIEEATV